jgi:GNAT superfamily N-acetyltransferase
MFVRVWEFRPRQGHEAPFRQVYGSAGAWVQLFRRAPGFLGTDLIGTCAGERFLTLDRWSDRSAWDAFLRTWPDEYAELDRECEPLVEIDRELALLRRATLEDSDVLAALSGELGYPTEPTALRSRHELIDRREDELVLIAERAGAIVGWVHVFAAVRLESEPFAELGGLVVRSDARGTGIGHALLASAEAWARERGFRDMCVRSNVLRERAHAFYNECGYHSSKTQRVFVKRLR